MVWNIGDITDSGNTGWENVGNSNTTNNSASLGVDLDTVGNVDNSVEENNSLDLDVTDSGNVDTGNTDWFIEGSGNDNSDNSDNSIVADIVVDSNNEYLDESVTDNSVNAGLREYNTGFEGFGGFGGGNASIWSQATILDQSVNQNIVAGGDVAQEFSSVSIAASGEGSIAAGGSVDISQSLDASTTIDAGGDVNMNNVTELTSYDNVGNSTSIDVDITDASEDWDIDGSFNDESLNVDVADSFNDDFTSTESEDWTINADVVWGSGNEAVIDLPEVDFDAAG